MVSGYTALPSFFLNANKVSSMRDEFDLKYTSDFPPGWSEAMRTYALDREKRTRGNRAAVFPALKPWMSSVPILASTMERDQFTPSRHLISCGEDHFIDNLPLGV